MSEAPQEAQEAPQETSTVLGEALAPPENPEGSEGHTGDTFPREYVEQLRAESAGYRVRAKRADTLAEMLVTSMARETGRLIDASDLTFDEGMLDQAGLPSPEKVSEAVEALLVAKPHLARIRLTGSVGQGAQVQPAAMEGLGVMLRRAAG